MSLLWRRAGRVAPTTRSRFGSTRTSRIRGCGLSPVTGPAIRSSTHSSRAASVSACGIAALLRLLQVTSNASVHPAVPQPLYPSKSGGLNMPELPGWLYPWGFFDKPCNTPSEFSHGRGLRHPSACCTLRQMTAACTRRSARRCHGSTRASSGTATPANGAALRTWCRPGRDKRVLLNGVSGSGRHRLCRVRLCAMGARLLAGVTTPVIRSLVQPGRPGRVCCPYPSRPPPPVGFWASLGPGYVAA